MGCKCDEQKAEIIENGLRYWLWYCFHLKGLIKFLVPGQYKKVAKKMKEQDEKPPMFI